MAISGYCQGASEGDWACRPAHAGAGILQGLDEPLGAQDRRADGGDHGAGTDGGTASIVVAFCWRGKGVGREGLGQGARAGTSSDWVAWFDRSLDHRRHGLSEEEAALGWGDEAVVGPTAHAGLL